jgi:hypothetical protein
MRAAAGRPGAFLFGAACRPPRFASDHHERQDAGPDPQAGPVAITVLAVLALASAWGASQWQLTALARAQDAIAADQKSMAADIRTIREGLAAIHAASLPNEERITDLRGRVRDPENRPRRMMPLSSSAPDRVGGGP